MKKGFLLLPAAFCLLAAWQGILHFSQINVEAKEKEVPVISMEKETERETQREKTAETTEGQRDAEVQTVAFVSEEGRKYKDGTYYGEGQGFGGKLKVEVIIKDGKISSISLVENEGDDLPYLNRALQLLEMMQAAQSTNVDVVSGATYSSKGLIAAVRNALNQALANEAEKVEEATTQNKEITAVEVVNSPVVTLTGTETEGQKYKNGVYQGSAICLPDENEEFDAYTLSLKVTIVEDKIVSITEVLGFGDVYLTANDKYIRRALEQGMTKQILDSGDVYDASGHALEFDVVSTATCSSKAIVEACRNAVSQAAQTVKIQPATKEEKETQQTTSSDKNTGTDKNNGQEETTKKPEDEKPQEEGKKYQNGTYYVEVDCNPDEDEDFETYTLGMNVKIAGDKIVAIDDVQGHGAAYIKDNERYITRAVQGTAKLRGMVAQIVEKGMLSDASGSAYEFDVVTGATCTSKSILAGCSEALEKAKYVPEQSDTDAKRGQK